ncbi:MAG: hypothetical protein IPF38_13960 [Burkholderiales bacterium]|nr:hypothetical protein [Burkholderiales bacterium]
MKKKLVVLTGSVFLIPLATGGFGIGVLMRADGKGRACGAFFGPRVSGSSDVEISDLRLENAVLVCRFGDYGLHTQRWPVVGSIPNWRANPWPVSKFFRRHGNPELCFVSEYDEKLDLLSEQVLPAREVAGLPEDAQFGSGVVEAKLDKLLR